ncbi:hypothetical protein PEC18_21560 [Paucibacter sp. O1-1]|nr:hypothetical protein [Paucibacter sp. O1-1]MDA3828337.1 hypothetical protein [Paucibacter sp. O1-1]
MKFSDVRALIFQRGWITLSGAATIFIVPQTLTRPEQGLFFTFLSLAAIQSIFEAGITSVFFNYTAHERAVLSASPEREEAERSRAHARLLDLVKIARRWFLVLSVLFAVLVGAFGFHFVQSSVQREGLTLHWQTPYLLLIAAISLSLFNLSRIPILEGFGQIADVAQYRLRSSLLSVAALWIGMATGWGLWALGVSYLLQNGTMAVQIERAYRRLELPARSPNAPAAVDAINWRAEILPLQFRLAGSYFCGYFIAQAVVPFTLHYHGAETAGQVGLMLSVFNALAAIVASYMYAAAPKYAEYIAHGNAEPLARIFTKVTLVTLGAGVLAYALVLAGTYGAGRAELSISHRLASAQVVLWMTVIGLVNAYVGSAATLLRAQKKEPMLPVSIAVALGYVLAMASLQSAVIEHLFMAFAVVQVCIALPFTILTLRKSGLLSHQPGTT